MVTWLAWMLVGCGGSSRPAAVPAEAVHVTVRDGSVAVDGEAIAPWSALQADPTDQVFGPLDAPLTGSGPLWLELPADAEWYMARRILGSARAAGRSDLYVSLVGSDEVLHPESPPRFGLAGTCPEGPFEVKGVEPMVTLAPQRGQEGAWVLATVRFLPVVELGGKEQPVDALPATCLRPPDCAALYPEGTLRHACEAAGDDPGERRIRIGGQYGCLLPIAKVPEEVSTWRTELAEVAPQLGLQDRRLLMIMPEARVRWDGVLALLGGLSDAGREPPALGTPLVEGNDGPPVCNAPVRTAAQLELAGATWVGGLAASAAPATPDAPPSEDGSD